VASDWWKSSNNRSISRFPCPSRSPSFTPVPADFWMPCPPTWWPNTKRVSISFIEERFPKVFEDLKEKEAIDDDLEKLMNEALTAYGEEFKDTI
jgi:hypothetical protein